MFKLHGDQALGVKVISFNKSADKLVLSAFSLFTEKNKLKDYFGKN